MRREDAGRVFATRRGRGRLSVRFWALWERMFDNLLAGG